MHLEHPRIAQVHNVNEQQRIYRACILIVKLVVPVQVKSISAGLCKERTFITTC